MDYRVIKITGKVVNKTGQNQGKRYAVLALKSVDGQVEKEVCVFDKEADKYLSYASTANGGMAAQDMPIPEEDALLTFVMDEEFRFPEPMVRVDENGKPTTNKFGQPYQRSSVRVTTRYNRDPQRAMLGLPELYPKQGWDLTSRGTSVMNAFYIPLREIMEPAGIKAAGPADDDSPVG